MEVVKKQRGGFRQGSGRKNLGRSQNMSFKVSKEERELINKSKGKLSLTEFILKCIKDIENER